MSHRCCYRRESGSTFVRFCDFFSLLLNHKDLTWNIDNMDLFTINSSCWSPLTTGHWGGGSDVFTMGEKWILHWVPVDGAMQLHSVVHISRWRWQCTAEWSKGEGWAREVERWIGAGQSDNWRSPWQRFQPTIDDCSCHQLWVQVIPAIALFR